MAVTTRSVGLVVVAGVLLHVVQVMLFGHDLIGVLDGHGLDVLPGLLLAPSPALLVGALALAFGLAVLVVAVVRMARNAPRTQLARRVRLVRVPTRVEITPYLFGARRLGRAPPNPLT